MTYGIIKLIQGSAGIQCEGKPATSPELVLDANIQTKCEKSKQAPQFQNDLGIVTNISIGIFIALYTEVQLARRSSFCQFAVM